MKRLTLCLVILLLIQATTAMAFNGKRQGFVLGGGLGFGPVAKATVDGLADDVIDKSGLAFNFVIGYAPSENDMIVYLRDAVVFSETFVFTESLSKKVTFAQGFSGVAWFHYFGPMGKSAYVTGGLGLQDLTSTDSDFRSNDPGLGLLIGGGYEFARHVQFHGSLSFGTTSDLGVDFNHTQLILGISAIAF